MPSASTKPSRWLALRRQMRRLYVRVVRAPGDPRDIALGMAVGVLFSLSPFPFSQTFLALGVAGLLRRWTKRRVSYLAAAAGTWLTNPLTFAPIYALSTLVGRPVARAFVELVGGAVSVPGTWMSGPAVLETTLGLVIGAVIVGIPMAAVSYQVTLRLVESYQRRRVARQRARALRAIGAEHLLVDVAPPPQAASGS